MRACDMHEGMRVRAKTPPERRPSAVEETMPLVYESVTVSNIIRPSAHDPDEVFQVEEYPTKLFYCREFWPVESYDSITDVDFESILNL